MSLSTPYQGKRSAGQSAHAAWSGFGAVIMKHIGSAPLLMTLTLGYTHADAGGSTDLREFLRAYQAREIGSSAADDQSVRFSSAHVNLDGRGGEQTIVYLTGGQWCGTGGCTTLVLSKARNGFAVVGAASVTRPPVRIMRDRSHGWNDIGVSASGGGAPFRLVTLHFNGTKYPDSPYSRGAATTRPGAPGRIVISDRQAEQPLN